MASRECLTAGGSSGSPFSSRPSNSPQTETANGNLVYCRQGFKRVEKSTESETLLMQQKTKKTVSTWC